MNQKTKVQQVELNDKFAVEINHIKKQHEWLMNIAEKSFALGISQDCEEIDYLFPLEDEQFDNKHDSYVKAFTQLVTDLAKKSGYGVLVYSINVDDEKDELIHKVHFTTQ